MLIDSLLSSANMTSVMLKWNALSPHRSENYLAAISDLVSEKRGTKHSILNSVELI
jgi:hypothetical protein